MSNSFTQKYLALFCALIVFLDTVFFPPLADAKTLPTFIPKTGFLEAKRKPRPKVVKVRVENLVPKDKIIPCEISQMPLVDRAKAATAAMASGIATFVAAAPTFGPGTAATVCVVAAVVAGLGTTFVINEGRGNKIDELTKK